MAMAMTSLVRDRPPDPTVWRAPIVDGRAASRSLRLTLIGDDRLGLAHEVSAVLDGLGAHAYAVKTYVTEEPHFGAPLFHMVAKLRLPPELAADVLRSAVEQISFEIMVDITMEGPRAEPNVRRV